MDPSTIKPNPEGRKQILAHDAPRSATTIVAGSKGLEMQHVSSARYVLFWFDFIHTNDILPTANKGHHGPSMAKFPFSKILFVLYGDHVLVISLCFRN